jgi:hypothetical protein
MNNNKEEKKENKNTVQTKQWKVGISEKGMAVLNQYLELANKNSKRRIRISEILEFAVEKLNEKDVRKIQERAYTSDDRMELMLDEYNQRNPDRALSLEAFKAHLLEVYDKQVSSKSKRSISPDDETISK